VRKEMGRRRVDPLRIITKYYKPDSLAFAILLEHGRLVAGKCLDIAANIYDLDPDISLLEEAAILHDIGIIFTDAPAIGCFGKSDYLCHGYIGRELLEREGFPLHALVCERHVGVGLSADDIVHHNMPLPVRDMLPLTLEEKIVCYADKFYSKKKDAPCEERSIEEVRESIRKYGREKLQRFDDMTFLFSKKSFRERDLSPEL
jgi:uncharacterized protein